MRVHPKASQPEVREIENPPRILFATQVFGYPSMGGPELYINNTLRAISANFKVELFVLDSPHVRRESVIRLRIPRTPLLDVSTIDFVENNYRMNSLVEKVARGFEWFLPRPRTIKWARILRDRVTEGNIEVIWIGYGNISFQLLRLLKWYRLGIPVICDTDSVWSVFLERSAKTAHSVRKLGILLASWAVKRQEKQFLEVATVVTAVSHNDRLIYQKLLNSANRVLLKPNVIELSDYSEETLRSSPKSSNNLLIHLAGSFGRHSSAMNSAANWFLELVWPTVLDLFPDTKLQIVGRNADWHFRDSENVSVYSDVPDISPFINRADIVVVPLLFESGTRFKILEAGAFGKPVVSTTLGHEGLELDDCVLTADSGGQFAENVCALISRPDLRKEFGEKLRLKVTAEYSTKALALNCITVIDVAQAQI